jgi:hypothetical protein
MRNRESIALGVILVLAGTIFLAYQILPESVRSLFDGWFSWPLIIVGVGLLFLIAAVATQTGGLAFPGSIVSGIGLIMYWQNATNNWDSWAYVWTLIPGFVGIGTVLSSVIGPQSREELRGGLALIGFSAIGFLVFGGLFNPALRSGVILPSVIILVGLGLLLRTVFSRS